MIDNRYFSHIQQLLLQPRSTIAISLTIIILAPIISGIGNRCSHDKIWSFASLFTMLFASRFATWFTMCPDIQTYITRCITCSLMCSIRSCGKGLSFNDIWSRLTLYSLLVNSSVANLKFQNTTFLLQKKKQQFCPKNNSAPNITYFCIVIICLSFLLQFINF